MPTGLRRYQTQGHDHLITFSCYRRLPYLHEDRAKFTFERILEATRAKYSFEIHGYVVMPEHVHLLLSEPDHVRLATALNVLKTQTSKQLKADRKQFWQTRYHDVNILTHRRWLNALRYIHRNPVKRGLVERTEDWPWSSYLQWLTSERRTVAIQTKWHLTEQTNTPHPPDEITHPSAQPNAPAKLELRTDQQSTASRAQLCRP